MSNEERLTAAGWKRLHQPCDLTMYRWSRDGIDWYTEDEALVVVLTAERDAAIARAERAEAQRDSARRDANGAAHRGDMACARADAAEAQRDALQRHFDAASPEHNLLALLDHYMELADAAEALAASRLEATEESEATLRGLLIGSHFYVQGGEYGDETFPRAEDARARAAELLTIERNRDVDNCVAWGVMITLGEEDAMGTAIEDADLDAVPALRAHAAKVSR